MKLMRLNTEHIWYCLYRGARPVYDADGYETDEKEVVYSQPVRIRVSVSPAIGNAQTEMFGTLDSYDKVIITDDLNCPIDEHSVLFIDRPPQFEAGKPLYDYTVKRVARSRNFISYAVKKVNVS